MKFLNQDVSRKGIAHMKTVLVMLIALAASCFGQGNVFMFQETEGPTGNLPAPNCSLNVSDKTLSQQFPYTLQYTSQQSGGGASITATTTVDLTTATQTLSAAITALVGCRQFDQNGNYIGGVFDPGRAVLKGDIADQLQFTNGSGVNQNITFKIVIISPSQGGVSFNQADSGAAVDLELPDFGYSFQTSSLAQGTTGSHTIPAGSSPSTDFDFSVDIAGGGATPANLDQNSVVSSSGNISV